MNISTKRVTSNSLYDLGRLFCTDASAEHCWCMWFIISVKEFHVGGSEQNKAKLHQLADETNYPLGVLVYQDDEPKGWCAVGPRERYARAIKTPTYQIKDDELQNVWLAPCFFIHEAARGLELSTILLNEAVKIARDFGASAIDGFPHSSQSKRANRDLQVGFESWFADCEFEVLRRPSAKRVVMRRILDDAT